MSYWLQLSAEVKRRPTEEILTPTQSEVLNRLVSLLRFPQRINLWGTSGCGKTTVAWALARATGARHITSPRLLTMEIYGDEILLVDNVPPQEVAVRRVLAQCNLLNVASVVLISRQPTQMAMRSVELSSPTTDDINDAIRTLGRMGIFAATQPSQVSNFWELLGACI